jgi:hypothetical protein
MKTSLQRSICDRARHPLGRPLAIAAVVVVSALAAGR